MTKEKKVPKIDINKPINTYAELDKLDQLDEHDIAEFQEILDQDY